MLWSCTLGYIDIRAAHFYWFIYDFPNTFFHLTPSPSHKRNSASERGFWSNQLISSPQTKQNTLQCSLTIYTSENRVYSQLMAAYMKSRSFTLKNYLHTISKFDDLLLTCFKIWRWCSSRDPWLSRKLKVSWSDSKNNFARTSWNFGIRAGTNLLHCIPVSKERYQWNRHQAGPILPHPRVTPTGYTHRSHPQITPTIQTYRLHPPWRWLAK